MSNELTRADIAQIIEGIEHFIIGPIEDPDIRVTWQPYIDKLEALYESRSADGDAREGNGLISQPSSADSCNDAYSNVEPAIGSRTGARQFDPAPDVANIQLAGLEPADSRSPSLATAGAAQPAPREQTDPPLRPVPERLKVLVKRIDQWEASASVSESGTIDLVLDIKQCLESVLPDYVRSAGAALHWQPMETMPDNGGPFVVRWSRDGIAEVDMVAGRKEYEEILGYGEPPALGWMVIPPFTLPALPWQPKPE